MALSSNESLSIGQDAEKNLPRLFALGSLVVASFLAAFIALTIYRFNSFQDVWVAHSEEATRISETLASFNRSMGYGGLIHNFKNLVLSGDIERYRDVIDANLFDLKNELAHLGASLKTKEDQDDLAIIRDVVTSYDEKAALVFEMIEQARSPVEIDAVVKINDTPALEAMGRLIERLHPRADAAKAEAHRIKSEAQRDLLIGGAFLLGMVALVAALLMHFTRRLVTANSAAQAASLSKGQFLANMSHEIRTPMNAILGLLNLLQSTELTSRQRDYASKSEGAAQSLLGLINDILDFSKVEAGKMTLESEPFHIDKLMRNLSVVLSANVGTKDIEVLFDVDPDMPAAVRGDAMRLQQVLLNLGGNAVKFTSEGQVVLSLRKLAQTEKSVSIAFAVKDTGIGIAPEHQAHIFSGFSQAEGSTTRRFGGTGLGLAISKRFVELMGGDIQITSEQGVGSTFAFTLEMPTVDVSNEPQVETQGQPTQVATLPQRVLVVDDNPIASELTLRMVRSWGWSAELAQSGKAAIELLSAQCATASTAATAEFPYPVIYMDWKMPEMDGWEATLRIRELAQHHQLPQPSIIMLTAHGRDMLAHRTEAEQEQINGFLVKPATASMLYDAWMDAQSGNVSIRKLTKGRSSARQLTGMRILVVEDNLINQQVADELLSSEGAIVSLASNGQLGVDAVAAAAPQFDVVLMDVQMPVLDGYGATRAIREELKFKALPIIAMTANAMASDREACLAAGMNEHIGKPFDMAKLVSLLIRMTGFHADTSLSDTPDAASPSASASDSPAPMLPVPEVAGLDIQTALNRMSGMRSLYVRTAKDFVKIMDTAVPELQQCLITGDKQQAMMRLHTLKGNAGTLGAPEMAAQAATLEKLCKTSAGMAECEAALAQFDVLVRDTQGKMREAITLLEAGDAAKKPETAQASDRAPANGPVSDAACQALHKIAALAKAADLEVLQEFAEVRELLAEFPVDSIEALDEALQGLDLEAASTILDRMILGLNG